METADRLRLDKWLWHARFCKTRSLAASWVSEEKIRVNRTPVRKPSYEVKVGDVLTLPKGRGIAVVRVAAIGNRRGPATEAQALYEEVAPAD